MTRSTFRLTVPQDLYDAVCEACEQAFADSYLYGATLQASKLTPRTVTAYLAIMDSRACKALLGRLNLVLVRPDPWSPGCGRPAAWECR